MESSKSFILNTGLTTPKCKTDNSATGQIPNIGPFQLIDRDTPESAYTHTSYETGETWDLVFSDEFNTPGRTFWPGGEYSFGFGKHLADPQTIHTGRYAPHNRFNRQVLIYRRSTFTTGKRII